MPENPTKLTPEKCDDFFGILAEGGSVTKAARAIRMSRVYLYEVRASDPAFAARWDDAWQQGSETLVDVAVSRGVDKSDNLLMFVIKQRLPEFRDSMSLKHSGDAENPIVTEQRTNPGAVKAAEDAYLIAQAESPRD